MAWTETDEYAALYPTTKGTLADKRLGSGIPVSYPFTDTVPTSPGAAGTVKLTKVPKGFKPRLVVFISNGLSASAGVGLTATIGDAADPDRLMTAFDGDAAGSFVGLAATAFNYEYPAETEITMTVNTAKTPTAGQKISGFILGHVLQ